MTNDMIKVLVEYANRQVKYNTSQSLLVKPVPFNFHVTGPYLAQRKLYTDHIELTKCH